MSTLLLLNSSKEHLSSATSASTTTKQRACKSIVTIMGDYSDEDGLFVGHIVDIKDVVGFHGESLSELRVAFEEAVTDYLETCAKLGRAP